MMEEREIPSFLTEDDKADWQLLSNRFDLENKPLEKRSLFFARITLINNKTYWLLAVSPFGDENGVFDGSDAQALTVYWTSMKYPRGKICENFIMSRQLAIWVLHNQKYHQVTMGSGMI